MPCWPRPQGLLGFKEEYLLVSLLVGKVAHEPKRPTRPELNPVSVTWSHWKYCYFLPGWDASHRWVQACRRYPFHTSWWRETMWGRVSCLTRWQGMGLEPPTFRSEVHCANHYTTAPPVSTMQAEVSCRLPYVPAAGICIACVAAGPRIV